MTTAPGGRVRVAAVTAAYNRRDLTFACPSPTTPTRTDELDSPPSPPLVGRCSPQTRPVTPGRIWGRPGAG
jgi:hypothetical protein